MVSTIYYLRAPVPSPPIIGSISVRFLRTTTPLSQSAQRLTDMYANNGKHNHFTEEYGRASTNSKHITCRIASLLSISIPIRRHCCFSFVSFEGSQVTGCLLYIDQGGITNFTRTSKLRSTRHKKPIKPRTARMAAIPKPNVANVTCMD